MEYGHEGKLLILVGGPAQEFPPFFSENSSGNALYQKSKIWVVIWQDSAPKIFPHQFLILHPSQC
jgi:hypothetical protein